MSCVEKARQSVTGPQLPSRLAQHMRHLPKRYSLSSCTCLGEGAHAFVVRAWDHLSEQYVALKVFTGGDDSRTRCVTSKGKAKSKSLRPSAARRARVEYMATQLASEHPNVISTLDCVDTAEASFVIFECAQQGDLFDRLNPDGHFPRSEKVVRGWAADIASALAYVHSKSWVHRDIKPENVLVHKDDGRALLADFGLAARVGSVTGAHAAGTGPYIAPELLDAQRAGRDTVAAFSADVWSFGIMLYAMLFEDLPWEIATPRDPDYLQFIKDGGVDPNVAPYSRLQPSICALLSMMLAPEPRNRCTMAQAAAFLAKRREWFRPEPEHFLQLQRQEEATATPPAKVPPQLKSKRKQAPVAARRSVVSTTSTTSSSSNRSDSTASERSSCGTSSPVPLH